MSARSADSEIFADIERQASLAHSCAGPPFGQSRAQSLFKNGQNTLSSHLEGGKIRADTAEQTMDGSEIDMRFAVLGADLVVLAQPTGATTPRERTFNDPATRQE